MQPDTQRAEQDSFFKELIKRRMFYIVGMYLGASVALMEFTGILIERFNLTPNLVDYVLIIMMTWLPGVILLGWRHGRPGKDRWGKPEAIGIPINAIVMVIVLATYSLNNQSTDATQGDTQQAAQLGSAQSLPSHSGSEQALTPPATPEVSKPNIEKIVESQITTKRLHAFLVDADNSIAADEQWLSHAITSLLHSRLDQHPHLNADSIIESFTMSSAYQILSTKGFASGLNIPKALKQQIARDTNAAYYTAGTISQKSPDQLHLSLKLYRTQDGQLIDTIAINQSNIFQLVEQAAVALSTTLELKQPSAKYKATLSTDELTTTNIDALKDYTQGKINMLNNDIEAAISAFESATKKDNQFALAYYNLAIAQLNNGQSELSKRNLNRLLALNYKTPDGLHFLAQNIIYQLNLDIEKMFAVLNTWVELYPNDTMALNNYARQLQVRGSAEESLVLFKRSLEIDPSQTNNLIQISYLYRSLNQDEDAIKVLQDYIEKYPARYRPRHELAKIYLEQGKLELAKAQYQQSSILAPSDVEPLLELSRIFLKLGQLQNAEKYINEAQFIANTNVQKASVLAVMQEYYKYTGQVERSYEAMLERMSLQAETQNKTNILFGNLMSNAQIVIDTGHYEEIAQQYSEHFATLDAPFNNYVHLLDSIFYLHMLDAEKAEPAIMRSKTFFDSSQSQNIYFYQHTFEGSLALLKGDTEEAESKLLLADQGFNSSFAKATNSEFLPVILMRLAETYIDKQAYTKAISTAKRLLDIWPYHTGANLVTAKAYFKHGDIEQAKQNLARVESMLLQASDKSNAYRSMQALKAEYASLL